MPFDEITERVSAVASKAPASIRLKCRKNGKPNCVVGLRQSLLENLSWKPGSDVVLMIGKDDDAGKIRLRLAPKGKGIAPLRFLKKNSAVVDLGFVAAFGDVPKVSAAIDAKVVDQNTIELTLPNWAEVPDDVEAEEEPEPPPQPARYEPPARTEPPRQIAAAPQPQRNGDGNGAAPRAAAAPIEKLGVRAAFHPKTTISFAGEELHITERQALMLGALTRGFGQIILTADLIHKMDLPASGGAGLVGDEFNVLAPKLLDIGLKIRAVPKMGYSLSKE